MEKLNYIAYVPIFIVACIFIISLLYCYIKYLSVGKNLKNIIAFLSNFNKKDLEFRFKELDVALSSEPFISSSWKEFKNTLVFSESVALPDKDEANYNYYNVTSTVQNIQTTVNPLYFFNEESLIVSKMNYKLIQTMPTILTGCGPLFTFLNIALAFGVIDLSSTENTLASISEFIHDMQLAALISVIAVGSCLLYLIVERIMYNKVCKSQLNKLQEQIGILFASISSEKFLYEMLKESKIQNNTTANMMGKLPQQFKGAVDDSMGKNLVPYLENVIFGLNQLSKNLKNLENENNNNNNSDVVDDLF